MRSLRWNRRNGSKAKTISIANNQGTPLAALADASIVLATPAEIIAGSTRMGAGTAQKIALNMMSTLMAIHLGDVHDGYMVSLQADNQKLKDRAARIVAAVSGCDRDTAGRWLEAGGRLREDRCASRCCALEIRRPRQELLRGTARSFGPHSPSSRDGPKKMALPSERDSA